MRTLRSIALAGFLIAATAFGKSSVVLNDAQVSGEGRAEVRLGFSGALSQAPSWQVRDNTVEISLNNVELSEELAKNPELISPHALVSRVRFFSSRDGVLKARVVINGTEQKLKERVQMKTTSNGVVFGVEYPERADATLALLKDEQQPVFATEPAKKSESSSLGWFRAMLLVVLLGGAAVCAFFGVKYLKRQTGKMGSRKHLIETLAYTPVGPDPKSGVGIIKVGGEFVMVGITPNHVSFLSNLKKLEAQYEDESKLERESFREAVQEEVRDLGRQYTGQHAAKKRATV